MIYILAWLALGACGAWLLHLNWRWNFQTPLCPSPAQILRGGFASLLGPIILLASLVIWLLEWGSLRTNDSWWTRPICSKRKS